MRTRLSIALFGFIAAASVSSADSALVAAHGANQPEAVRVSVIQPAANADLILLGGGFAAGLRQGMQCLVSRDNAVIGEVLLVDLRHRAAAGLITRLVPGEVIRAGDLVFAKRQSS